MIGKFIMLFVNAFVNDHKFRLSDFDWTDPTAKRFVKPGMYREAIFFGNTTGWKDDLKELLREIYQFDYYDANIPVRVPSFY